MKSLLKILVIFPFSFSSMVFAQGGQGQHGNHDMHGDKHHSSQNMHSSGNHGKHMMQGYQKFDEKMKPILTEYLKLHRALMSGKTDDFKNITKQIADLSSKLDSNSVKGEHAGHYKHVPMNLKKSATTLGASKNLKEAQEAFKSLSKPMAMWVGMAKPKGYSVMYCPMVKASWVQKDGETQNPYDTKMPRCGSKV